MGTRLMRGRVRFTSSKSSGVGGDTSADSNQKAADFTKQIKDFEKENIDMQDVQDGW